MRRRKHPAIASVIGSCVFCDNGAQITLDAIVAALDADRGVGFADPTADEVTLLVCGGDDGVPPAKLRAAHPALDALLIEEMT